MGKAVTPAELTVKIGKELTVYHKDVIEKVDKLSAAAIKKLVKLTKATAPVGKRGSYKRNISGKLLTRTDHGNTYIWYVKGPDGRLTHLLVHGHATKNGGRTQANPFLENAMNQVLPEYKRAVEEALKE